MVIKSFRGQIANDGKETISLHTNDGSTGYKIVKLEVIGTAPGTVHIESVLKIFTVPQTATPTGTIDFSDNTLEELFSYIADNYNIKEFIEKLIDFVDLNFYSSSDDEVFSEDDL